MVGQIGSQRAEEHAAVCRIGLTRQEPCQHGVAVEGVHEVAQGLDERPHGRAERGDVVGVEDADRKRTDVANQRVHGRRQRVGVHGEQRIEIPTCLVGEPAQRGRVTAGVHERPENRVDLVDELEGEALDVDRKRHATASRRRMTPTRPALVSLPSCSGRG